MPPEKTVNRDFLRQVLKGEKMLLAIADCKFVTIPHYDELGVRHIFEQFRGDEEVMKYLQDEYPKVDTRTGNTSTPSSTPCTLIM